jgi:hypothetical protein
MDKLPEPVYDTKLKVVYKGKDNLGAGAEKREKTKQYIDEYFDKEFLELYFHKK